MDIYNKNRWDLPSNPEKNFRDGINNGENDNDSYSLYQRVGVRTAYIFRLIKRQNPPPVAEAIAFGIYGNPMQGGGENV
jgi:hypothetical protein